MATHQARREALGPLGIRLVHAIPRIAFISTIVISTLTPLHPMKWMVYVLFYGESGVHMEDRLPPLVQFIDGHGRGYYERMTDSTWSTLLHVLPALLWLLLWPAQFTSKLRWNSPWLHRSIGTILMIDAALVLVGAPAMCAAGACYTRAYPRPWPLALNRFWKPPFMPFFLVYGAAALYRAYTTARLRQFKLHRRWIIRLNALFLGVTLSRPVLVLLAGILWDDPRAQDLDFRWKLFWDVIWMSNLAYIVLAEIWLATESYFGLGAVAVRPPSSAPSSIMKSTSPPS